MGASYTFRAPEGSRNFNYNLTRSWNRPALARFRLTLRRFRNRLALSRSWNRPALGNNRYLGGGASYQSATRYSPPLNGLAGDYELSSQKGSRKCQSNPTAVTEERVGWGPLRTMRTGNCGPVRVRREAVPPRSSRTSEVRSAFIRARPRCALVCSNRKPHARCHDQGGREIDQKYALTVTGMDTVRGLLHRPP